MKKNVVVMAAALGLVAAVGLGSTFAYFTDKEEATNTVSMGHVDIVLTENGEVTEGLTFENQVPGDVLEKKVDIKLAANSKDAYVRVKVTFEDSLNRVDANGAAIEMTDADRVDASLLDISDAWTLGEDGYYYYNGVVGAQTTATLFNTVTLPTSWNNAMADASFSISIEAEAVQADNNSNKVWPEIQKYVAPATTAPAEATESNPQ